MRRISRCLVCESLIRASIHGLDFLMFNCRMRRFVRVIVNWFPVMVPCTACRLLGADLHSQGISLLILGGSCAVRDHLHSVHIYLAADRTTRVGQSVGTCGISSF